MELQLRITGILLILLSMLHIGFPRYFSWKKECAGLSLINRQMMYVHTFFIGLVVLLIGALSVYAPDDLLHTRLGHVISFGIFIFWAVRLLFQFFVYSPMLWRGKKLETAVHILFSLLWCYLTTVFFLASGIV